MRYTLFAMVLFMSYPVFADDNFWRDMDQQQIMFDQQQAASIQEADNRRAFQEQKRHNEAMEEYAEKAERRAQQREMDKLERELYPKRFGK